MDKNGEECIGIGQRGLGMGENEREHEREFKTRKISLVCSLCSVVVFSAAFRCVQVCFMCVQACQAGFRCDSGVFAGFQATCATLTEQNCSFAACVEHLELSFQSACRLSDSNICSEHFPSLSRHLSFCFHHHASPSITFWFITFHCSSLQHLKLFNMRLEKVFVWEKIQKPKRWSAKISEHEKDSVV